MIAYYIPVREGKVVMKEVFIFKESPFFGVVRSGMSELTVSDDQKSLP